jgi:hypothetical protein
MRALFFLAAIFCMYCATTNLGAPLSHTLTISPEIRIDRDGTYESGDWKYVFRITQPGTRSEGSEGTLSCRGIPVPDLPENRKGDWIQTPWGKMIWNGREGDAWIPKGWLPAGIGFVSGNGQEIQVDKKKLIA